MLDQISDGANFEAVFSGKQQQVGQPGHGAVVVHDLADHGGGRAASHAGEVATGFGVTGAHQHAAVDCLQREDVTGLHQVIDFGVFGNGGFDGAGTVSRRDAGGHAFSGFNGDGEGGSFFVTIAQSHGWQLQPLAAFFGEGQADQAATKACHEVDGLGGDVVGRQHQVAFVFAVFFVNQNNDFAGSHLGNDVFDRRNCNCHVQGFLVSWSMRST